MIADYIKYLFRSHNRHGVHSPFVYELNEKVFNNRLVPESINKIKGYRKFLAGCNQILDVDDPGSGSRKATGNKRAIREIYLTASGNERMGLMLFHLLSYFSSKTVIELGTNLGVSTAYLSAASVPGGSVYSIEGSKAIYNFTSEHFKRFFPSPATHLLYGDFNAVLPGLLKQTGAVDLAFVDGNHTYEDTVNYFKMFLPYVHNNTVLVFDDIYWSDGMKQAWQEIKQHEQVTCSIDLFRWGIVLFRKEMKKEDFTIRFDGFLQAQVMQ